MFTKQKIKKNYINKCFTFVLLCTITSILCVPFCAHAQTKKIRIKKKITRLYVGETFRYRISHRPKKASVSFHSSNRSIASISKKKGVLKARKKGNVSITVKIKSPRKKTIRLKTSIRILNKSKKNNSKKTFSATQATPLKNVSWKTEEEINPWTHKLVLYSNRILLTKEVKKSLLTLTGKQKKVTASFDSLSSDGKKVTYQIKSSNAQKLCPGNGTANGIYKITSPLLNKPLFISYKEILTPGQIQGFVSDTLQTSLSGVTVTLHSKQYANKAYDVTTTDSFGFYSFKEIPKGSYYLSFTHKNYSHYATDYFLISSETHCENVQLKFLQHSLSIYVHDAKNQGLSHCPVELTDIKTQKTWSGYTDANGFFVLSNQAISKFSTCSMIKNTLGSLSYHSQTSHPLKKQHLSASSTSVDKTFTGTSQYTLTIFPDNPSLYSSNTQNQRLYETVSYNYTASDIDNSHVVFSLVPQSIPDFSFSKLHIQNAADIEHLLSNNSSLTLFIQICTENGCPKYSTSVPFSTSSIANDFSSMANLVLKNDPCHLQEGTYIFSFFLQDNHSMSFYTPVLKKLKVQQGLVSPISLHFTKGYTANMLVYGDFPNNLAPNKSLTLYEKFENNWIPIKEYHAATWTSLSDNRYKTYLQDSLFSPGRTYSFCPCTTESDTTNGSTILFPNSDSTEVSLKFYLSEQTLSSYEIENSHTATTIFLDTSFFCSDPYKKNCVYATYTKQGKFCAIIWTDSFYKTFYTSNTTTFITNRFKSGMPIFTNHPSYQNTNYFLPLC